MYVVLASMIGSCFLYQFLKDFAGPIATIIASVTAAIVAWRVHWMQVEISKSQLRTSRQKLKLDLFEKHAVYVAVRDFIFSINQQIALNEQTSFNMRFFIVLEPFDTGTADACFLFGNKVVEYLLELRTRINNLKELKISDIKNNDTGRINPLVMSFTDEISKLKECFRPFLGFGEKDII